MVAGLLSLFGALTYAELAAAMPEAGGEYVYLSAAYGPFWGYLYGWTQFWVAKSGSIATLAAGFYTYLTIFYSGSWANPCWLTRFTSGRAAACLKFTTGSWSRSLLILILGWRELRRREGGRQCAGRRHLRQNAPDRRPLSRSGLFSGTGDFSPLSETSIPALGGVAGFFRRDGERSVGIRRLEQRQHGLFGDHASRSAICHDLLIFGTDRRDCDLSSDQCLVFLRLDPGEVAASSRRSSRHDERTLHGPAAAKAVTMAVLISIFAALNGSILSGSRVPYAMARDGLFFRKAACCSSRVIKTPGNSIVMLCLWSCVVVLSGWFDDLYNFVIFGSWILYLLTAASVFVLRRKRPEMEQAVPGHRISYRASTFYRRCLFFAFQTLFKCARANR